MLDYLRPQLPEIFNALGIEHSGQFLIEEGLAKQVLRTSNSRAIVMRHYNIHDKDSYWNDIPLLCFISPDVETVQLNVQAISEFISYGWSDFYYADFTGDGIMDVFTISYHGFADRGAATAGVFSFNEDGWDEPLFWSYRNNTPMPYDYGWELPNDEELPNTGEMYTFTLKNKLTGYTREFEDIGWYIIDNGTLQCAEVYDAVAVDVDGDAVYEIIIQQSPFKWPGYLYSLLRFNTKKKCFETEYAAYLDRQSGGEDQYDVFLKQAGYNIKEATFLS